MNKKTYKDIQIALRNIVNFINNFVKKSESSVEFIYPNKIAFVSPYESQESECKEDLRDFMFSDKMEKQVKDRQRHILHDEIIPMLPKRLKVEYVNWEYSYGNPLYFSITPNNIENELFYEFLGKTELNSVVKMVENGAIELPGSHAWSEDFYNTTLQDLMENIYRPLFLNLLKRQDKLFKATVEFNRIKKEQKEFQDKHREAMLDLYR